VFLFAYYQLVGGLAFDVAHSAQDKGLAGLDVSFIAEHYVCLDPVLRIPAGVVVQ
jgi:hypothetical protein